MERMTETRQNFSLSRRLPKYYRFMSMLLQTNVDSRVKSYGAMLLLGEMSEHLARNPQGERPMELYNVLYEFFRFRWDVVKDFPKPLM